ncbi:MAG: glutathione S-transferase family protein, partial [Caulobacteraceae bacterium]
MALTIHGSPRSRTQRVLWMAEELGLDYEHDPLAWDDPRLKSPAFLAINPAGAIPTIEDDDLALPESLAINLYLAKKHSLGGLYPASLEEEAQVWRWSLWAQAALEPWLMRETREAAWAKAGAASIRQMLARSLATLERALTGREWLVGEAFTVADFNVACVLSPSRAETFDLTPYARIRDWLSRCYARPAAVRART